MAGSLPLPQRRILGGLWAVVGICVLATAARVLLGPGAGLADAVFTQWLLGVGTSTAALLVAWRVIAVPAQRRVWLPLAAGLGAYALGTLLWAFWIERMPEPPFPSFSDPLWLAVYPAAFASAVLVLRAQIGQIGANLWLDGVIGALAITAISGALIVPLTDGTQGSFVAVVTNLAYPLGDLLLLAVLAAGVVVTGWRPTAPSVLLAAGFLAFGAGDVIYLAGVTGGDYVTTLTPNLMWMMGVGLIARAAWTPIPELGGRQRMGRLLESVPMGLAFSAVGLLALDHAFRLGTATVGFAAATLVVTLVRLARSAREERLLHESRREAQTDELTGLPNRRALNAAAAVLLRPGADRRVALLLIDLNDFKELNDSLGHEAGDQLLTGLGRRLARELRPGDLLVRLGGDEFAVLIDGYGDTTDAEAAAWRLLALLEEPFPVQDIQLRAGASIGIACAPMHGTTPRELLRCADIAMYRAKAARTGVHLHDGGAHAVSPDRLALAGELARAFAEGEIVPYFQPQVDPRTRRLTGTEALVRWEHPVRGTLGPGHFLVAIEQMNLARRLTLRMIECAADFAVACAAAGHDLPVSVNLSAANLMDDALLGDLGDILRTRGLVPDRLRLEVTEGIVMTDPDRAIELLRRVRELGVGVSLDDFGTDHSSLSYLNRLPVDELKIDRSFVADLLTNPRTATIVASTLALARALKLSATAEGIEDAETLERLAAMDCDAVQGFHIARPMPAADLLVWADAWKRSNAPPAGTRA